MALLIGIPVLGVVVDRFGWRSGLPGDRRAVRRAGRRRVASHPARRPGPPRAVLHPDALLDEAVGGPVAPGALAAVADAPVAEAGTAWWQLPARTVLTLAAVALLMGAVQLVVVVEGVWFEDAFGFSTARIGVAVLFIGIAELIGSLGSSRLTDRVGQAPQHGDRGAGDDAGDGLARPGRLPRRGGHRRGVVGTLGFEYALVSAFPLVAELDTAARGTMFTFMLAAGTAMRGVADAVGATLYDAGGISAVGLTSASVVAVVLGLLVFAVREPGRS